MESLLCDEDWLSDENEDVDVMSSCSDTNGEELEETFMVFLEKEASFLPEIGYMKTVESNDLIQNVRVKAINRLIQTQKRVNLSNGTVFHALNYFDRFISCTTQCQGWKSEMFEVLLIACLCVASKFNETSPPPLHKYKMEGLFEICRIQKMELRLLQGLEWRMDCVTSYSYIELLMQTIDSNKQSLFEDLKSHAIELLINAALDSKFLEFQPSVIAISVMRCIYGDLESTTKTNGHLTKLSSMMPKQHKDDMRRCQIFMGKLLVEEHFGGSLSCENSFCNPSSPVTVLNVPLLNSNESSFDLSPLKMNVYSMSSRKRKWEEIK